MPCIDACSGGNLAAADEECAQGAEGMAVLVRVAHAHALAVGQLHLSRALDVQEEDVDRIVHPCDLASLEQPRIVVDVGARVVRHDAVALDAPAQALVVQVRIERREVDGEQVGRRRVDRVLVARGARAAAVQQRLVVAGDHAARRVVGIDHAPHVERGLEIERHFRLGGGGRHGERGVARGLPCGVLVGQHGAAAREGVERWAQRFAAPVGKLGPRRGHELAAHFGLAGAWAAAGWGTWVAPPAGR